MQSFFCKHLWHSMGRSEELGDVSLATVIGCYLCSKAICEISYPLDIPQSSVWDTIRQWKWKQQLSHGMEDYVKSQNRINTCKKHVVCKSNQHSTDLTAEEFQTSSGINVSHKTVQRELHWIRFHGWTVECKPYITKSIAKHQIELCNAHWLQCGAAFRIVTNHASVLGCQMRESAFWFH